MAKTVPGSAAEIQPVRDKELHITAPHCFGADADVIGFFKLAFLYYYKPIIILVDDGSFWNFRSWKPHRLRQRTLHGTVHGTVPVLCKRHHLSDPGRQAPPERLRQDQRLHRVALRAQSVSWWVHSICCASRAKQEFIFLTLDKSQSTINAARQLHNNTFCTNSFTHIAGSYS